MIIVDDRELFDAMKDKMAKEKMDNIIMTGFIPLQEIPKLYSLGNCLIHHSKYEYVGLILIEAMAYGIPVIATKMGAMPEIVSDKEGI